MDDPLHTTTSIPDSLLQEAREQFKREREQLAREMDIGYREEAERPSLDLEWSAVETEGL